MSVSCVNLVEEGSNGTKGGAIRVLKEEGQWGEVGEINKTELRERRGGRKVMRKYDQSTLSACM